VLDVKTRGGNNDQFAGSAGASPLAVSATVEGPIWYGQSSFLASVRRSTIETVSPFLLGKKQPLYFEEQFAKYERVFRLGRCSATGLHTYDRGKVDPERSAVFAWSNYALGGRCVFASPASPMLVEMKAGISGVNNSVGAQDQPERNSSVWRFSNGVDLTVPGPSGTEFRFGFQVGGVTWPQYDLRERFQGIRKEEGFYLTNRLYGAVDLPLLGDRLFVQPSLGLYDILRSIRVEPRLRMSWQPWGSEAQELNAALTLHHQLLQGISDERDAGAVFTAWLRSPIDNQQSQALHALLGWKQQIGPVSVSAEGYYKRLRRLPVPIWSTRARLTTELDQARGTVYGFDTRVEYERGRFYGYVGYQLSRTLYELEDERFGTAFGDPVQGYPPPHDRRHNLNVLAQARLPGDLTASVRWQIGSGRPYTAPRGFDRLFDLRRAPDVEFGEGEPRLLFDRPYGARLPYYHRLDVNLERTFEWRAADLTVKAGAINSYDRRNLFYFDLFTFERIDQLPIVPFLSLKAAIR